MSASWETEFSTTNGEGRHVEYQTRALAHHSRAERPDRVRVSGLGVVHKGWVSDHKGYEAYKRWAR